ncbi:alcohol dehydrogenase catalytic domain-containing protein [Halocatena marina]|uniref:alcohol dehydrogenase catalytic domain-containing protein n=1 Tax=Halocatena marina TaxID=2934937 RepID=UPI002224C37E|nr:alcohol dehydrogenase catalytic domain-containing protein [Halocatena marina]
MSLRDSTVHEVGQPVYVNGSKDIEFREHPVPEPGADAVVIKIERTNVCDSELHVWRDDHPLSSCILAHEAICRVSNFGEKVDTDGVGQQISEGDLFAPRDFQTCQQ